MLLFYGSEFCHKSMAAYNTIVAVEVYYSIVAMYNINDIRATIFHNTIVNLMNYQSGLL